jgi:hypothetical protein
MDDYIRFADAMLEQVDNLEPSDATFATLVAALQLLKLAPDPPRAAAVFTEKLMSFVLDMAGHSHEAGRA